MRNLALRLAPLVLCSAALAETVDFEGLSPGEIVQNQIPGLRVRARNLGGGPHLAIVFDSHATRTADPDLEDPWSGGNLPADTFLGNLLILAENAWDWNRDGLIDRPDDEGSRPAGKIVFYFDEPVERFGLDLVDVEDTVLEGGKLIFRDIDGTVVMYGFDELGNRDTSIAWGNNTVNRVRPFTRNELGINSFDRVVVFLGGSGAIDNLVFGAAPIPEPSTFALSLLAVAALAFHRFRRRPARAA